MGWVCPINICFWLKMNRELLKNKPLYKKRPSNINQVMKPPDRMPIVTLGLVQLSFIHNLI